MIQSILSRVNAHLHRLAVAHPEESECLGWLARSVRQELAERLFGDIIQNFEDKSLNAIDELVTMQAEVDRLNGEHESELSKIGALRLSNFQKEAAIQRAAKEMGCEPDDEDDFVEAVRLLQQDRDRLASENARLSEMVKVTKCSKCGCECHDFSQVQNILTGTTERYCITCAIDFALARGREDGKNAAKENAPVSLEDAAVKHGHWLIYCYSDSIQGFNQELNFSGSIDIPAPNAFPSSFYAAVARKLREKEPEASANPETSDVAAKAVIDV